MTDLPPYKNLVPEIPRLGVERKAESWIRGSLHFSLLVLLPSGAPWNPEVLDGMASCLMPSLMEVAEGSLA